MLKGGFAEHTEGSGQHRHVMVLPQNEIKGDVGMSHHEKESNKKIKTGHSKPCPYIFVSFHHNTFHVGSLF